VRENGRYFSLCGESIKTPSKGGNATLRENSLKILQGFFSKFLSEISLREPLFEGIIPVRF
jgi:hypothetical protein